MEPCALTNPERSGLVLSQSEGSLNVNLYLPNEIWNAHAT